MIKKINECSLKGVKLIELNTFNDFRGSYQETYNYNEYIKNDINVDFVQDDLSISNYNVLRGLHGEGQQQVRRRERGLVGVVRPPHRHRRLRV